LKSFTLADNLNEIREFLALVNAISVFTLGAAAAEKFQIGNEPCG